MINNPIIFYIASFLIISFALLSMFLRNIIYSLLCAVMVFFSASIFFYILGSEYNAIIQAAIYGLAVPVIIGVSVMFTSGKGKKQKESMLPTFVLLAASVFAIVLADVLIISLAKNSDSFHIMDLVSFNSYDVISEFARGIYIDYVWSFELMSLLLTIVIAGFTLYKVKHIHKGGKQ